MKKVFFIMMILNACLSNYKFSFIDIPNEKFKNYFELIDREGKKAFIQKFITKINESNHTDFRIENFIIIIDPGGDPPDPNEIYFWFIRGEEKRLYVYENQNNILPKQYNDAYGYNCEFTDEFIQLLLNKKYDVIKEKIKNDFVIENSILTTIDVHDKYNITVINTLNAMRWRNGFNR